MALCWFGLGAWGLAQQRDMHSLLDMNKEGLVSVLGYWALHLWGAAFANASGAAMQVRVAPLCNVLAVHGADARTRTPGGLLPPGPRGYICQSSCSWSRLVPSFAVLEAVQTHGGRARRTLLQCGLVHGARMPKHTRATAGSPALHAW